MNSTSLLPLLVFLSMWVSLKILEKMSMANLLQLKTTSEQHLSEPLQILNVVILTNAEDGINRTVIVNDNFDTEKVAEVVIDHLEAHRLNITMFSSTEGEEDLKKILLDNLDWRQEIEFAVSNLLQGI